MHKIVQSADDTPDSPSLIPIECNVRRKWPEQFSEGARLAKHAVDVVDERAQLKPDTGEDPKLGLDRPQALEFRLHDIETCRDDLDHLHVRSRDRLSPQVSHGLVSIPDQISRPRRQLSRLKSLSGSNVLSLVRGHFRVDRRPPSRRSCTGPTGGSLRPPLGLGIAPPSLTFLGAEKHCPAHSNTQTDASLHQIYKRFVV